jgi:HEAT repeat protein
LAHASSLKTDHAIAAHVEALRAEDAAAGVKAAKALARLGPRAAEAPEVLDALLYRLADEDKNLARWAGTALGSLGPAAVPPLCQVLSAPDTEAHVLPRAAAALQQLGAEAAPAVLPLTGLLRAAEAETRLAGVGALGAIGPAAATAVPALVALLEDAAPVQRQAVIRALERIGPAAAAALPALIALLGDGNVDLLTRCAAAQALGELSAGGAGDVRKATAALAAALEDPSEDLRWYAAIALQLRATGAWRARPARRRAAAGNDDSLRVQAEAAIDAITQG